MFLGDFSLLNLLLNCIDQDNYLPSKKVVLIEALCIILYDCLTSYDSEIDTEKIEAQKDLTIVLEECVKRKDKIAAVGKELPGYLRDLVFPKIGLK